MQEERICIELMKSDSKLAQVSLSAPESCTIRAGDGRAVGGRGVVHDRHRGAGLRAPQVP